jgi:hypothetical protein
LRRLSPTALLPRVPDVAGVDLPDGFELLLGLMSEDQVFIDGMA